jgi:hypothetical protein
MQTFAVESSYVTTGLVHYRRACPFCEHHPKPLYGYRDWGSSDPFDKVTAGRSKEAQPST